MIRSDETEIRCTWTFVNGKMQGDEGCDRITQAIERELRYIGSDRSGWEQLYVDPRDGRFWELTFPMGSMHGGGPKLLKVIGESQARQKYGDLLAGRGE